MRKTILFSFLILGVIIAFAVLIKQSAVNNTPVIYPSPQTINSSNAIEPASEATLTLTPEPDSSILQTTLLSQPEVTVTPSNSPAPLPTPTATLPPPIEPLNITSEVEVVVLLGTDNIAPFAGRTDSMMLVFLNPPNGTVSMVSIPRDLYVYLPGVGMDRINTAYVYGGTDMVYKTFEYNLGVRPDHWALVHLDGFQQIIDDLGGIDVWVTTPLPDDCGGVPPGMFHMYGELALCYVRSRYTTDDFDRSRRQQEVLQVIYHRVLSLDAIPHLADWFSRYNQTIQTDLTLGNLVPLVPLALRLRDMQGLHPFQITRQDVIGYQVPGSGASVLLPQRDKISTILQQAIADLSPAIPTPLALPTSLAELTASPASLPSSEIETPTP
jgi:polyisoprenyl-teichoic acid--peptidoglycan teichoic acid transferase